MVGSSLEADRLRAVARYRVLGTRYNGALDRIARLAARVFGTPIATVSIVDTDTIWFKAAHGLDGTERRQRLTLLELEKKCRCEACGSKNARVYPWWGEGSGEMGVEAAAGAGQ